MTAEPAKITHPWDSPPEDGLPFEVAPGIWWLRLPLPMALDHVNCWLLDDGEGWTIVDTGFDGRAGRAVWGGILDGTDPVLGGRPVRRVIVTHHHPDHVGLAGWLTERTGAELWMTRTAWLMARMLVLDLQETAPPETIRFWKRCGMDAEILKARRAERPFNFADVVAPLPLGFRRLDEGQAIDAGGRRWRVRLGGGHAPDHATLWDEGGALVIAGDQVLPRISPNLSLYATEPEADPVGDWLSSCRRLQRFADDSQLVLPGHGRPFTGLPTRLRQLEQNHVGALERLLDHLSRKPLSAGECFPALFKRQIGKGEYGLALGEAAAHCHHLWRAGKVTRAEGADGAWRYKALPR